MRLNCRVARTFLVAVATWALPMSLALAAQAVAPDIASAEQSTQKDSRVAWRTALKQKFPASTGCFTARFPEVQWRAVACAAAHSEPYVPAAGDTVGAGTDFSAETPSTFLFALGTFTTSGITSESSRSKKGTKPDQANAYSLQINSNNFVSPTCENLGSSCKAWQQFIYSSARGEIFMQYWLLHTNGNCPMGWKSYVENQCWINSHAEEAPIIPASDLNKVELDGFAQPLDNNNLVVLWYNDIAYTQAAEGSVLNLSKDWKSAEFNVFGASGGSAIFNSGSTIWVNLSVYDKTTNAPACTNKGTTAESNNLTLSYAAPAVVVQTGGYPTISFMESDPAVGVEKCLSVSAKSSSSIEAAPGR